MFYCLQVAFVIVLLYFVVNEARELAAARREAGSFAAGLGVYFSSLEVCCFLSSSSLVFSRLFSNAWTSHTHAHSGRPGVKSRNDARVCSAVDDVRRARS